MHRMPSPSFLGYVWAKTRPLLHNHHVPSGLCSMRRCQELLVAMYRERCPRHRRWRSLTGERYPFAVDAAFTLFSVNSNHDIRYQ